MRNQSMGIIREFKTKQFTVRVEAFEDYDTDLSFDDSGEVREKLETGEFVSFQVEAKVYCHGEEVGADYLGGCIYKDVDEFQDHRKCGKQNREYAARGESGRCGSYFKDMISEAISEARKEIATLKNVYIRQNA